jgi:hypothetical protein
MDPQLVQRALGHIQEHINILSDPNVANILMQLGQQPIMPPAPMPPQGGGPEGGAPPAAMASPQAGSPQAGQPLPENAPANSPELQAQMAGELPQPATPAEPPPPHQDAPTTSQEAFMKQIGGG